mmetsp:Transcript_3781/g.6655  ORF Transcript_3781/g.6655 Transcript_3781/m.6655 type:complete len:216 (+) Transcript_3781:196-843(+)
MESGSMATFQWICGHGHGRNLRVGMNRIQGVQIRGICVQAQIGIYHLHWNGTWTGHHCGLALTGTCGSAWTAIHSYHPVLPLKKGQILWYIQRSRLNRRSKGNLHFHGASLPPVSPPRTPGLMILDQMENRHRPASSVDRKAFLCSCGTLATSAMDAWGKNQKRELIHRCVWFVVLRWEVSPLGTSAATALVYLKGSCGWPRTDSLRPSLLRGDT